MYLFFCYECCVYRKKNVSLRRKDFYQLDNKIISYESKTFLFDGLDGYYLLSKLIRVDNVPYVE